MTAWILLSFLSSIYQFSTGVQPPNIKFVSYSYNAMKGNPNAVGQMDPGWNMQNNIFDLNTNEHPCLTNYSCPSGVAATLSVDCNQNDYKFTEIPGSNKYHNLLTKQISLQTNYSATLSGSTDFQHILKTTESKSNQNVYTSVIYQCQVFEYSIQNTKNMSFTKTFIDTIQNLPDAYGGNEDYFYKFLTNSYGTHYVNKMNMGCIAGQLSQMSSFQFSKFSGSNLPISDSARYSTLSANGASSVLSKSQKEQASDFNSCTLHQYTIDYGGKQSITNGNYSQWKVECKANPVPINKTSLYDISTLLTAENFPNISDIKQKQTAMINALYNYCTEYAKRNTDQEIDCNGWPNDLPLPKLSIVSGFVVESASGWNEPVNPYTGARNCPADTKGIAALGLWNPANVAEKILVKMCIDVSYGKTDPLGYFGGMYSDGTIKVHNNFTGNYSCPKGFDDYIFMGCPSISIQCIQHHICFNSSVSLDKSIIGGVYTTSSDDVECQKENQYTHKMECPNQFKAYNMGQTACGTHPGMYATLYVCLNNVYQV